MKHPHTRAYDWSFDLTAGILFAAAVLRAFITYSGDPIRFSILLLLAVIIALYISGRVTRLRSGYLFILYLAVQAALITVLLFKPGKPDYFALLYAILSMQIMQRTTPGIGVIPIAAFSLAMFIPLHKSYGFSKAIAFTLIYTAMNAFLASYSLALRRAYQARQHSFSLAQEFEQANHKLKTYSQQLRELGAAGERNRLARELHDSVTQTVFSMTLTTESSLMLLERDPGQIEAQLERLYQLSRTAMSEMHVLIERLNPIQDRRESIIEAIHRHLTDGHVPENLSVSIDSEGDGDLNPEEAQTLFRIFQEALNNIIKHASADHAWVRLNLNEPYWLDISDDGCGFEPSSIQAGGGIGLSGMMERTEEIGWQLTIRSSPGMGTTVRVQKEPLRRM